MVINLQPTGRRLIIINLMSVVYMYVCISMNKVIVYNVHLTYANVHNVITHVIIIGEKWVCLWKSGKYSEVV